MSCAYYFSHLDLFSHINYNKTKKVAHRYDTLGNLISKGKRKAKNRPLVFGKSQN